MTTSLSGDATVPIPEPERVSTGIPGLDDILGGGLDPDRIYLVEGHPGTGKTTLALHYLLEGASRGETGLYVTLSESERELRLLAARHGWSLDNIAHSSWYRRRQALIPSASKPCFTRPRWNSARRPN